MGLSGSKAPALVEGHHLEEGLPPGEEERIQAPRLAQLSDVADVVFASQLDGCFSSVLESAAATELLRALVKRNDGDNNASRSAPPVHAQQPDFRKRISAALLAAADKGHARCLGLLLDAWSSSSPASIAELLDARDGKGHTALIKATDQGQTACVQLLLHHSPDIQVAAVTPAGHNALMCAAAGGHAACVLLLLHHSPDAQVAAVSSKGFSALMFAAMKGDTACEQLLLHHSPDIQVAATTRGQQTALMLAAAKGHTACAQLLLHHSPDIQVAAHAVNGGSALICAADEAHADCLQLLLSHGPSKQQLSTALRIVCRHLSKLTTEHALSPDKQRRLAFKKCAELLLANGAVLPADAIDGDKEALQSIIMDLAARALVPDMANEAVVGLALAATSCRKSSQ